MYVFFFFVNNEFVCIGTFSVAHVCVNKSSKTYKTVLKKQGWTHKRRSLMDLYTVTYYCWLISKDLHQLCADTECSQKDQPGVMYHREIWQKKEFGNSVLSAQLDADHVCVREFLGYVYIYFICVSFHDWCLLVHTHIYECTNVAEKKT